jgi:hypothetical protein
MADDEIGELCDRLVPLLKEYDSPTVIMALSSRLAGATAIATEATTVDRKSHRSRIYRAEVSPNTKRHKTAAREGMMRLDSSPTLHRGACRRRAWGKSD